MIRELENEIYIIVLLIAYGIYISAIYDATIFITDATKLKKITKIIIELFICILQIIITYQFAHNLANGYIPIFFILFVMLGLAIYFIFCKKQTRKTISEASNLKKLLPLFVSLFISKDIIRLLKKINVKIKKSKNLKKQKIKQAKYFTNI